MSKAKKKGLAKINRSNLVKRLNIIKKNEEIIKQHK